MNEFRAMIQRIRISREKVYHPTMPNTVAKSRRDEQEETTQDGWLFCFFFFFFGNVWIPVKPGADTERLLLRSGIGAIACGRLLLWATPWLLRGHAAPVTGTIFGSLVNRRTGWRKKKARIGVVVKHQEGLGHRNIWKFITRLWLN